MTQLFSAYLQAGFFSTVMILAVLLLRPFLRKAPRNALCILWLLVAVRLLLPFQLESNLSLQPRYTPAAHTTEQTQPSQPVPSEPVFVPPMPDTPAAPVVSETSPMEQQTTPVPSAPVIHEQSEVELTTILGGIWIGGVAAVLLYAVISYGIIRRRVRDAIPQGGGIWESHRIPGAFLLGYVKPRIYLPEGLHPQDRDFILAHEQTHIRRRDNWWKLLGMICVSIHWYNPLVWLSYGLLCRDIEVACDQRVIQDMPLEERKAYSFALLNSGKRMYHSIAYPVTFGEVNLKQRIKHVLSYRKPGFWITVISVVLVLAVGVCFLTVPKDKPETPTTSLQEPEATEPPANREAETEPTLTESEVTEPESTEPEVTEPEVTEPEVTEPEVTEPEVTEPEVTEPEVTEPEVTEPEATEPEATEPEVTEPEVTEPIETQPKETKPTEPEVEELDSDSFITEKLREWGDRKNQSHGYDNYNSEYSHLETLPTEPEVEEPDSDSSTTDELREWGDQINLSHGYGNYNSDYSLLEELTPPAGNQSIYQDPFPPDPDPPMPSPPATANPWSYTPPSQRGPQSPSVTIRIFP